MNKTLYEEALADAQKLRELAEETAKHRVLESIMPQIKSLVDSRIIGEQMTEFMLDDTDDAEDQGPVLPQQDDAPEASHGESEVEGNVLNITAQGNVNIDMSAASEDDEPASEDDFVLTDTMAEAVRDILSGKTKHAPTVAERVTVLSNRVSKLKAVHEALEGSIPRSKKRRFNLAFAHCVKEAMKLRSEIILMEHGSQDVLELKLTETIKEMKNMSKSNRNIFDFLFEAEEDKQKMKELEEAELSLELDDEEKEELAGAEDAEAVDTALEDILGDLEVAMGDAEVEDELGGDEPADEEEPAAEEEGEELDLGEAQHNEMDEVYEIDEAVLRRELRKMRRLREQEEAVETYEDHPAEEVGDVFYDVDEDDLINVLADELGPVGDGEAAEPETVAESRIARRVRARRAAMARRSQGRNVNEARVVRKYQNTVNELKKQLVEMNLFNAKLLYANKLMQNKNLSVKQQRAIVEALDNAKTIREAKLLYKSLSESLTRRARGKKLNEGALRTLGSSSRSTRSAQPASSGVEVDRWAVLAGLHGKN